MGHILKFWDRDHL